MADIKQAAKWMQEGRSVRRPDFFSDFSYTGERQGSDGGKLTIVASDGASMDMEGLNTADILAEDWEIAE